MQEHILLLLLCSLEVVLLFDLLGENYSSGKIKHKAGILKTAKMEGKLRGFV